MKIMTQQSTIEFLNNRVGTKLKETEDEYCDYDAIDDNYIVEIKNRREYFKDKLIEAMKLFKNYQASQLSKKQFLYVVTDEKGIWVFNISKKISSIVNKPLEPYNCSATTDFNNKEKIIKYCYTLSETMATHIEYDS